MENKIDAILDVFEFYKDCCLDEDIEIWVEANNQLQELLNAKNMSNEEDPGKICD